MVVRRVLASVRYALARLVGWAVRLYTRRLIRRGIIPSVHGIGVVICAGCGSRIEPKVADALKAFLDVPAPTTDSFRRAVACVRVTDKLRDGHCRYIRPLRGLDLALGFVESAPTDQIHGAFAEVAVRLQKLPLARGFIVTH